MMKNAHKLSLLRQLAWAGTLAIGFGTLWPILSLWLTTSIQEAGQGGNRLRQESLNVWSDGAPLIRSVPLDNLSHTTYRDLNGQPHHVPDGRDILTPVYMPGEHEKPVFFSEFREWQQRLKVFVDQQEPTVFWYFVHDGKPKGAGYFVGYERTNNRRIGFIGLSGFCADPVPSGQQVPVRGALMMDYSSWSSEPTWIYEGRVQAPRNRPMELPPRWVYIPSGNLLRKVDLVERTVTSIFETPEPIESVGIASLPSAVNDREITEQLVLVRTAHQIYAMDRKQNVVRVFAVPSEIDPQSVMSWYEIGKGQAIADFGLPSSTSEAAKLTSHIVYRIAADGTIQDRFELTLQSGSPVTSQAGLQMQAFLALPAPAILFVLEPLIVMRNDRSLSSPAAFSALLGTLWPSLVAVVVLASILAVVTWRRSRSFGLPKREQIAWVFFVLLLGLFAFVGFLLHRRWPIRQPCPSCNARAPRDRVACAECGTLFPEPSPKGIEIFA
jgi:hypothetical protein